jgi:hypothetical protein
MFVDQSIGNPAVSSESKAGPIGILVRIKKNIRPVIFVVAGNLAQESNCIVPEEDLLSGTAIWL